MGKFFLPAFMLFTIVSYTFSLQSGNVHRKGPPPIYELYYFGSQDCSYCQYWRRTELRAWPQNSSSKRARLYVADIRGDQDPFAGAYGRYDAVFMQAFGRDKDFAWPSFALLADGKVIRTDVGLDGWEDMKWAINRIDRDERNIVETQQRMRELDNRTQ